MLEIPALSRPPVMTISSPVAVKEIATSEALRMRKANGCFGRCVARNEERVAARTAVVVDDVYAVSAREDVRIAAAEA